MSYTDPKQIKDNTLGIVSKVAQAGLQNLNAARRAEENAVSKNISNIITGAVNAGVKSIAPKQSALNATNRAILKSSQNMYKKIGSSAMDTGYEEFDANNEDFWNQIVSKYNATAQAMKQGTMIDNSRGAQDLAMYENIVDIYAQSVPNIRATAQAITKAAQADHGSGERLSVAGAPAYQLDIIRHAAEGEGNIQIIQRGNNIILFDPNVTYIDENGKEKKGGELNLNEFNRSIEEADGKNPYLRYATNTKPETKQGFDELIKQGVDGTNTPKYVTEKVTKNPNNGEDVSSYSMTPAQQDLFINDQIGKPDGGGYATGNLYELTVENHGESIWEDQMQGGPDNIQWPDDIPEMPVGDRDGVVEKFGENSEQVKDFDSQAKEYDDFYNTFYEPTLKYLAGQSLQNSEDAGIVLLPRDETTNNTVVEEEKEEEDNKPGSGGNNVEEIKINEEETVVVEEDKKGKKGVNKALKIDVGDGNDYIRKMFNYENTSGNSSGGGVKDYGFTGQGDKGVALKKLYDEAEGTSGEKGIKVVNEYIIGTSPNQEAGDYGTTILADLGMDRETYDKLPENIKEQLVDWKFNTGRGSADLIAIASGIEIDGEKWDGVKAFENNSPTSDKIEDVDFSKLTPKALYDARQELYSKRVEGMEKMLKKDPDNEILKRDLKFAKDGYNNSQINRLKVDTKEESAEELVNNLTNN